MKRQYLYVSTVISALWASLYLLLVGCSAGGDSFYMAALGLNEGRILVANSVTNPGSKTIVMYDLSGRFISVVADRTSFGENLRGLALFDPYNFILSTDTPDELKKVNIFNGHVSSYASNALFTGNIYDTIRQSAGVYLTVESNTIEKFINGQRTPSVGNPYINTTTGGCTISAARGLAINSAGELLVSSFTNNLILRYDISTSTASCLTSISATGTQPVPIVIHPDGNAYFGTQGGTDTIYSIPENLSSGATAILSGAEINNPVAMAVLPNGNLLIANDGTDVIIEITTAGVVVNSNFIKDAFVGTVSAMLVIPPQ
ncbi:MAG: hypothetical protein KDD38_02335 [Bdellovibrionales bacterium]|nr:hypothetical protein [Bdellovibrionales bacterium]